jgi:hypothetical protein
VSSTHVEPDLAAYSEQIDSLASAPEARQKPRNDDDTSTASAPIRTAAPGAGRGGVLALQPFRELTGHGPGTSTSTRSRTSSSAIST